MDVLIDQFPVFESNQVLSNRHLNDVFNYLDQQTRWTRSYLIGIGIVCGLEIKLDTSDGPAILLSRGCGVTSEGYLIIEPDDATLVSYRDYTPPDQIAYPPFAGYPLWELFPSGEPNTTLLDTPSAFLDDKAVVLFLELKKEGLRNCSPNNCDDKGSQVTATVRRLLIERKNLDAIIAAAEDLGEGLTSTDIDRALSDRLNLPDIRLRRFDVLNSNPVTSNDIYEAFFRIFRSAGLAGATTKALSAAYAAFEHLLKPSYPTDPFANFAATFGFLDVALTDPAQVRFLQYYVDLFDDLVRAYDEFRWKGAELICACCPPEGLFPRHLMLGLVNPDPASQPGHYRQRFLASPAIGHCADETDDLLQLFARLVEMTQRFSNTPSLPNIDTKAQIDPQIRITPSTLGERPLAAKAIPYYYEETGAPPLYSLWSREKTRRSRSNQNLSYRSDEYDPIAPAFVLDPLRYDLEPYDFLRIEGHLGKPYQPVMSTLVELKSSYRLPIDIIALHTGAYDEDQQVDLGSNGVIFRDLEALYDALREELLASLAEAARELYEIPTPEVEEQRQPDYPKLPLLKQYVPTFRYASRTLGAAYEKHIDYFLERPYVQIDQTNIDTAALLRMLQELFGSTDIPSQRRAQAAVIFYVSELAETLPDSLAALDQPTAIDRYQDLLALLRFYRSLLVQSTTTDLQQFAPIEQFVDLCEAILFGDRSTSIIAICDEYRRRIVDLRKRQVLSNFLAEHPGIQHKAGTTLGGTFIVVYHSAPQRDGLLQALRVRTTAFAGRADTDDASKKIAGVDDRDQTGAASDDGDRLQVDKSDTGTLQDKDLLAAIARISSNRVLSGNADIEFVIGSLTGKIRLGDRRLPPGIDDTSAKVIAKTVSALLDGEVIADFYLPYRVSSTGIGVNYVLPKAPPVFTIGMGCTTDEAVADVSVDVRGGVAPYSVAVDNKRYRSLVNPLSLPPGKHIIRVRDTDGTEAAEQEITVAEHLVLGKPTYECSRGNFTADVAISGGTPPYRVNGNLIDGSSFRTDPAESGSSVEVEVLDGSGCSVRAVLTFECPVVEAPSFTTAAGCTGDDDKAEVTVTAQGGTAPYEISVDDAAYEALDKPLSLAAGQHSLKLRDHDGVETASQSITITPPISVGRPQYECSRGMYTARIDISGGTPPYKVNDTAFAGGVFTSDPVSSGKQVDILIRDSKGCESRTQLKWKCPDICLLPCEGQSLERGFRFWIPEPNPDEVIYERVTISRLKFLVDAAEGKPVDLTAKIEDILQPAGAGELDSNGFAPRVQKWLEQINQVISEHPDLNDTAGSERLILRYEQQNDTGRMGILWMQYFACLGFDMEMVVTTEYRLPGDDRTFSENRRFIYTTREGGDFKPGTTIDFRESITNFPPFGGSSVNKCDRDPRNIPMCPEEPAFKVTIRPTIEGPTLFLDVTADPDPGDLLFVWEILDSSSVTATGPKFQMLAPRQKPVVVIVTAFDKNGCTAMHGIRVDPR